MHPTLKLLPFLPLLAAKSTTPVNTDPYTGYNSDSGEYVFSVSISLLLDQILSLETCFTSSCSVDMFHGSTMII